LSDKNKKKEKPERVNLSRLLLLPVLHLYIYLKRDSSLRVFHIEPLTRLEVSAKFLGLFVEYQYRGLPQGTCLTVVAITAIGTGSEGNGMNHIGRIAR